LRSSRSRGFGVLALFVLTGAVLGGIIGEFIATTPALSGLAPYLSKTVHIFDTPPVTINLYVVKLVIGLALDPNLISIFGVILAIYLFRKF